VAFLLHSTPTREKKCGASIQYLDPTNLTTRLGRATRGKHGGAPIWVTGSYDPETNLTFWGVGNPGPDWNGDGRLGDNLYSCSVIALDADTGKLKWHYQFSPHNEFDWDSVQVPVLADLEWNGHPRKVMLWANRSGVFYVLDRTTGEFLMGKPSRKRTGSQVSTRREGPYALRASFRRRRARW